MAIPATLRGRVRHHLHKGAKIGVIEKDGLIAFEPKELGPDEDLHCGPAVAPQEAGTIMVARAS
jgi:hypothetical protein